MFTLTALYIFAVMCFSAFLHTVSGFGFALAAAPLLLFAMEPKSVVMFVLLTASINNAMVIARTWREGEVRSVLLLFAASVAGSLPGAYALKIISGPALKIAIGIVLILAAIALSSNHTIDFRRPRLAKTIAGCVSGFLNATTSFSGPAVMLYYLNSTQNKETIRADLARFFLMGNCVALALGYYWGTLTLPSLVLPAAYSVPAIALGVWIGDKLFRRLDPLLFRRIALWTIVSTALANIAAVALPMIH